MATCIGCGLTSNVDGLLEVQLRPGGGIECDEDGADAGLFLTPTGPSTITTTPGDCTIISGNGAPGTPLRVDAEISGDACNGITCRANGLFAHCPDSIVVSTAPAFGGGTVPFGVNALCAPPGCSFNLGTASSTNFCNTVDGQAGSEPTCCTVSGFWSWIAYGGVLINATADFEASGFLTVEIDGGGFAGTPQTNKKYYGDADKTVFELGGFQQKDFISVAPGVCHQINARFTVLVAAGSATWQQGPQFESYVHLTQTGCC